MADIEPEDTLMKLSFVDAKGTLPITLMSINAKGNVFIGETQISEQAIEDIITALQNRNKPYIPCMTHADEALAAIENPTQNPVKCSYCNDTGKEVRNNVECPCRCLTTMD